MKKGRVISFALGNVWRWEKSKNRDDFIKYAKKLNIDGVEITLASREELFAFKLSRENEKFLKSLDYVTIHAPFDLATEIEGEKEIIDQLKIISDIYKQVRAKNVIIHPYNLPSRKILDKFSFKASTENLRKRTGINMASLKEILKKYPKLGLCLDVSHAYTCSKQETAHLIKSFGNRITQFHLSGTYKKKDHQSLQVVSRDFLTSIEPLLKAKAPIVIEEDMKIKSENLLKKEVEFIRKFFGG